MADRMDEDSSQQLSMDESSEKMVIGTATFKLPNGSAEDPALAQRLQLELDEQNHLVKQLAEKLDACQTEDILTVYDEFAASLRQLIAQHGSLKTLGYAGVMGLPMVIGTIIDNLKERLPEECQPQSHQLSDLCTAVLRRFDPSWRGSPVSVQVLAEFFKPYSFMLDNALVLRKRDELWVRDTAQSTAQQLSNCMDRIPEVDRGSAMELLGKLTSIAHGCFPYGFNSENEHRYKQLDLDPLLHVAAEDPIDQLRLLSPSEAAYLQRNARDLLDAMDKKEIEPDSHWAGHLHLLVNGNFPHGFRLQENAASGEEV